MQKANSNLTELEIALAKTLLEKEASLKIVLGVMHVLETENPTFDRQEFWHNATTKIWEG